MKKKAQFPTAPAHPDMSNPNPWAAPRACPNCGEMATGYHVESSEDSDEIVLTCKKCGFQVTTTPNEEFLVEYRGFEAMKKKKADEGLFTDQDIDDLFSGEIQLEQEDVDSWYGQLDQEEVERFRMLQEKEQKQGLTPEETQELAQLTEKMDALLSQAKKTKISKLVKSIQCALCSKPLTMKAARSCIKYGLKDKDDMLCEACIKDFEIWEFKAQMREEPPKCTSCRKPLSDEDIEFYMEKADISPEHPDFFKFVMCYDCLSDVMGEFEEMAFGQQMREPAGNPEAVPIVRTYKKEILAKDPKILDPAKWSQGEQPRTVEFRGAKFRTRSSSGYGHSWDLIPLDDHGKKLGRLWMTDTGTVYRGDEPLGNIEDSVVI